MEKTEKVPKCFLFGHFPRVFLCVRGYECQKAVKGVRHGSGADPRTVKV